MTEEHSFKVETTQAVLAACESDVASEEARTEAIDSKLSQLAAFSGISISISAAVGASVVAGGRLSLGFTIALGACLAAAAVLLLSGVIIAFRALSPKEYAGVDEAQVARRTTPSLLREEPAKVIAEVAAGRRDILKRARAVNDDKARRTSWVFLLVGAGFLLLVTGLVVAVIGSVV